MKPLKTLMLTTTVIGDLKAQYSLDPQLDSKGNPISLIRKAKLELTVKVLPDQPKFRASYGVLGNRLMVECHILKSRVKIENDWVAINLSPTDFAGSLSNEFVTFTIIETSQYTLKPLTKIFGTKFTAIQDGSFPAQI